MTKVADLPIEEYSQVSVNPDLFYSKKQSLGGVRGKSEYRRCVGTNSIIGRHGSTTYFRGECWNCRHEMICYRSEKRQSLHRCPECDETSVMYKGFFNHKRNPWSEYVIPKPEECISDMYILKLDNDNSLDPSIHFTTKEGYEEKAADDSYWDFVEVLEIVEVDEKSPEQVIQ